MDRAIIYLVLVKTSGELLGWAILFFMFFSVSTCARLTTASCVVLYS